MITYLLEAMKEKKRLRAMTRDYFRGVGKKQNYYRPAVAKWVKGGWRS